MQPANFVEIADKLEAIATASEGDWRSKVNAAGEFLATTPMQPASHVLLMRAGALIINRASEEEFEREIPDAILNLAADFRQMQRQVESVTTSLNLFRQGGGPVA